MRALTYLNGQSKSTFSPRNPQYKNNMHFQLYITFKASNK